jgi:hypothetical protein
MHLAQKAVSHNRHALQLSCLQASRNHTAGCTGPRAHCQRHESLRSAALSLSACVHCLLTACLACPAQLGRLARHHARVSRTHQTRAQLDSMMWNWAQYRLEPHRVSSSSSNFRFSGPPGVHEALPSDSCPCYFVNALWLFTSICMCADMASNSYCAGTHVCRLLVDLCVL